MVELSDEERMEEMGEPLVRASFEKKKFDGKPYYEHPAFDWNVRKLWINDQNAVNYWLKNINQSGKYPENFDSKTY